MDEVGMLVAALLTQMRNCSEKVTTGNLGSTKLVPSVTISKVRCQGAGASYLIRKKSKFCHVGIPVPSKGWLQRHLSWPVQAPIIKRLNQSCKQIIFNKGVSKCQLISLHSPKLSTVFNSITQCKFSRKKKKV